MELIKKGTSITAIILLSLLGVFATVFTREPEEEPTESPELCPKKLENCSVTSEKIKKGWRN